MSIQFCSYTFNRILDLKASTSMHLGLPVVEYENTNEGFLAKIAGIYLVVQDGEVIRLGQYGSTFQKAWMYTEQNHVFRPAMVNQIDELLRAGKRIQIFAQDELSLKHQVQNKGNKWAGLNSLKNQMKDCVKGSR